MPAGEIHPWPKNPRKITERAVTKVAALIKQFGFSNPILVRLANGEIIGGHTRYRAALKLGMASVPVRYMDLSEEDAHALAIADNRSGEETEWDDKLLAEQIRGMRKGGREVASLAFDDDEIDAILKRASEPDHIDGLDADGSEPHGANEGDEEGHSGPEGTERGDSGVIGGDPADPTERRARGNPVVSYSIVFDTEEQQVRWYGFLRFLKKSYESAGSVGERLVLFLDGHPETAG